MEAAQDRFHTAAPVRQRQSLKGCDLGRRKAQGRRPGAVRSARQRCPSRRKRNHVSDGPNGDAVYGPCCFFLLFLQERPGAAYLIGQTGGVVFLPRCCHPVPVQGKHRSSIAPPSKNEKMRPSRLKLPRRMSSPFVFMRYAEQDGVRSMAALDFFRCSLRYARMSASAERVSAPAARESLLRLVGLTGRCRISARCPAARISLPSTSRIAAPTGGCTCRSTAPASGSRAKTIGTQASLAGPSGGFAMVLGAVARHGARRKIHFGIDRETLEV